jgi:hypothetical protein
MELVTQAIRKHLPPICSQSEKGPAALAHLKLFTPDSSWTWYVTEFDGEDLMYGLVDGHEKELGYFSLSEMQAVRGPLGLAIERDIHWTPTTLGEIAPELFGDS